MSQPETLSLSSICALINPSSVYLVGYAWVLGMCAFSSSSTVALVVLMNFVRCVAIWITFFSGTIAFRALPRYQFGALQRRIFPVYFAQGFILPAGLLVLWVRAHPTVLAHLFSPAVADVAQAYSLASGLLMQAANHYIVGPLTTRAAYARYKQEKTEGKMYDEQGISDEMKALNARFNLLHAISVGLNLTAVAALVFHGLWIGNTGTGV